MSQIIQWDPTATTLQAWRLWIYYTLCQVSRTAHSARASILFQPTMTITAVVFPQQINIWWDLIRYDIIPYRLQAKLLIYILTFLPIDLFTIYFICYWECFPNGHSIDSFAKVDDISTVLKCSEKVTQHDNIQFLNSGHHRDRMHEELEYSSLYKLSQWVVEELLTRIRGLVLLLVLLLAIIMLGILAILYDPWSMMMMTTSKYRTQIYSFWCIRSEHFRGRQTSFIHSAPSRAAIKSFILLKGGANIRVQHWTGS